MVFDVTDKNSFEKVKDWMGQIKIHNLNEKIVVVLVGNKCDHESREVTKEEGEEMAKMYKIAYFETSALQCINIDETFGYLSEKIISSKENKLTPVTALDSKKMTISIDPTEDDKKGPKNKKCC